MKEEPKQTSREEKNLAVEIKGSGFLNISYSPEWRCGGEKGFSVNVNNKPGGVMPALEALKLADHIYDNLDEKKVKYKLQKALTAAEHIFMSIYLWLVLCLWQESYYILVYQVLRYIKDFHGN